MPRADSDDGRPTTMQGSATGPLVTGPFSPQGRTTARRHRRWLEMHETLGCSMAEVAGLVGRSLRAVKAGVASARKARAEKTVADALAEDALFSFEEMREFSKLPEAKAWLASRHD